ncbi:MAG: glycosyltransferase family 4 protein [Verrucomicrobia bacterium]|nr:glycosyltransferase family 4 protein [Verrucomicrobiota bacterium]
MNAPRLVIYVHHERALGGAPLSLLYLLRQIDRARYAPQVLCLREGPAAELFRKEGLPVRVVEGSDLSHTELVWFRWWQFPKLLARLLLSVPLFWRLRRALKAAISSVAIQNPTIVHLNSSTLVVAALAARSLALPVVWHIREPLARGCIGFRRALLRLAIRALADHVIAISRNDAAQLGAIPASRLSVIYNFVDFAQFDANMPTGALRKELDIAPNAPIFLFLGGSARVKGAEVLLQAVPALLGGLRSAHLVIAGEISASFRLKILGADLAALRKRIHLLGARQDAPLLFADATVVLFPSVVPHFARPVIEAAAMAKPVVASDLDGVRELVLRNETAVLVPPGDPVALAQAIMDLAQDAPRAFRLGQQGLALAREKFDARRNAAATFAIYAQLPASCNARP